MLTPPADLPEQLLAAALDDGWGLTVKELAYQPVGWGSHHWSVTDAAGARWFLTVDELVRKRRNGTESLDDGFRRLSAALSVARDLHEGGLAFVVAPVSARGGRPLVRVGGPYAAALYPHLDGQSFGWGEYTAPGHREAVLEMVVGVHTAPPAARRHAVADDFTVPDRAGLHAALAGDMPECGPYARRTARLLAAHAQPVRELLARYDGLVAERRDAPVVLTHGEPHPGNTMLTTAGWRLIDWDTALLAPPERDLWLLAADDESILTAYAQATGHTPRPSLLDLYRVRWTATDLAVDVARFRNPHTGTADDTKSFQILTDNLTAIR
ncbi:phosphotransferase [Catellatospora sp. NPDC049609]|uniref:phosphotransferase enzyme family protein n=1 Tax=Catellatospora sp. NPDC049609 TaxID=3155505 RepID=UPI0034207986